MRTAQEEKSLKRSVYRKRGAVDYKSCPRCSAREGRLVFYPVADYGERTMENGAIVPQSWCRACRNKGGRHAEN